MSDSKVYENHDQVKISSGMSRPMILTYHLARIRKHLFCRQSISQSQYSQRFFLGTIFWSHTFRKKQLLGEVGRVKLQANSIKIMVGSILIENLQLLVSL